MEFAAEFASLPAGVYRSGIWKCANWAAFALFRACPGKCVVNRKAAASSRSDQFTLTQRRSLTINRLFRAPLRCSRADSVAREPDRLEFIRREFERGAASSCKRSSATASPISCEQFPTKRLESLVVSPTSSTSLSGQLRQGTPPPWFHIRRRSGCAWWRAIGRSRQ